MNIGMRQFQAVTGGLWGLAVLLLLVGCILDNQHLEHASILTGLAATGMLVVTAIRWGTGALVHVLALYNDDLLTPEGAELIGRLVPPPRHAAEPAGMGDIDGHPGGL